MTKETSFGVHRGLFSCLLILSLRTAHICVFQDILVLAICDHFLLLLEIKTDLINIEFN